MSRLLFGFADEIITPELNGTFLDGYGFRMSAAEYIRDDLHAKVMAVGDGRGFALLFSIDLIGVTPYLYRLMSANISAITGVPKERISLSFIHTHAAPAVGTVVDIPVNVDYIASAADKCGAAALRAMKRAEPCSVSAKILPEKLIHSINRRGLDIIDRSIRAAAFRNETGELKGVICSASCHAVINTGMSVSADWLSVLNRESSDDVPYLFFQGRAGDVNPTLDCGMSIDGLIETLGSELAAPVRRFAESSAAGIPSEGEIRCGYEKITVKMKPDGDISDISRRISEAEKKYFSETDKVEKHYALREMQWLRERYEMVSNGISPDITVPLQYIALGDDLIFAFLPFEPLTNLGNCIEKIACDAGWPAESVYVCGYSNSNNGYLAARDDFETGGYEITGASHWYGISESREDSADTVIDWFRQKISRDCARH